VAVRVAMWSGPRNISTAMMRSWENRADCVVADEPFYAFYLSTSGIDHPGADEVIASQPTDWRTVAAQVTSAPLPDGATVAYQKHMTHHMLPEVDLDALEGLTHAFLVRDPAEVLLSYAKVRHEPTLEDLGWPQQLRLYESFGGPVVEARDVLEEPERTLRALCGAVGVAFDPAMLAWPAGRRDTDGVWARHWYDSVRASTGFGPYRPPSEEVPERLRPLLDRCRPYYEALHPHRLRP
jgi:hypothetical protein